MRYLFVLLTVIFFTTPLLAQLNGFKLCNPSKVYTLQDYLLEKGYKEKLPYCKQAPRYKGGEVAIQGYFDKKLELSSQEASQEIKRTIVGFVVDCEGRVGDTWLIIDEEASLSSKIQEIIKAMPK